MTTRAAKDGRIASALRRLASTAILAAGLWSMPAGASLVPPMQRAAPLVRATPALWEIRDADTTIYLFGTFHSLNGRTAWFDHKIRSAFDRSGELVLETVIPADSADVRAAAHLVSDSDSADGQPTPRPFIAQTRQVASHGRTLGLRLEHGADAVLRRVAVDEGKSVEGLEQFEAQLGALARIPIEPAPIPAFFPVLSAAPPLSLSDLLDAWTVGDTTAFSAMLAGFEAKSPAAYRMLIADPNARWGQWIADRLDRPGVVFVAVGSGHLAGKDSVQRWLSLRGIWSTRIS